MLLSLFFRRRRPAAKPLHRSTPLASFAHDGADIASVREAPGSERRLVFPVAMIAALVAIALGFRVLLILDFF